MPSLRNRLIHGWNAFLSGDDYIGSGSGASYGSRPDRVRLRTSTARSIVTPIITRIGIDVASIPIRHVRLDQNERFTEVIQSGLNTCLSLEANIDQSARAFIQDAVMSMCDEGCVAMVPVDTTIDPTMSGSYDIQTMRTGKIVGWEPEYVTVNLYNQKTGLRQDKRLPKKIVAIVENPLYSVMNEPNSTLQRLIEKLNLLDAIDQQSGSGKLDLIIQLPFVIKTEARRIQAEARRKELTDQLQDSKYGIAYTDGSEKITQLNRPAENNLMNQIEFLTRMLYSQLGITEEIFAGTADEKIMINYNNRTIEPMITAIVDAMKRTFLTKTGRSQGQSIFYMRDPFRFVPASELGNIADSFTRNAILSSNEFRGIIGFKPSSESDADKLRNKNLNQETPPSSNSAEANRPSNTNQNGRSSDAED